MDWNKELKEANWPLIIFEIFIMVLLIMVILREGQLEPLPASVQYVVAIGVFFLTGKNLLTKRR